MNVAVTAWVLRRPGAAARSTSWAGAAWRPGARRGRSLARLVPVRAGRRAVVGGRRCSCTRATALNFLPFTEQPGTIWGDDVAPRVAAADGLLDELRRRRLRRARCGRSTADAGVLLCSRRSCCALAAARRWRSASFALDAALALRARSSSLLTLVGLLVMAAGFPEGTPLRRGRRSPTTTSQALQFLRTTYKAGPLVALGLAALGGGGAVARRCAGRAAPRARSSAAARRWSRSRVAARHAAARVERQLALRRRARRRGATAAADLDARARRQPRDGRCPGQLFAYYRWGGTIDPILPALTDQPGRDALHRAVRRPALGRPAVDGRRRSISQRARRCPASCAPLLDLHGRRRPSSGAPTTTARAAAAGARRRRRAACSGALGRPARAYGPRARAPPARAGTLDAAAGLPQVRALGRCATGGIVRVLPRAPARRSSTAARAAIAELAAFGALRSRPRAALRRRPRRAASCARRPRAGATFVISDSNRRRAFVAVAPARQPRRRRCPPDEAPRRRRRDPRPVRRPRPGRARPSRVLRRRRASSRAASRRRSTQFPEHRPFAALDGDPATAWLADRALAPARHHLDVTFDRAARRRRRRPDAVLRQPRPGRRAVTVNGRALRASTAAGTGCRSAAPRRLRCSVADRRSVRQPAQRRRGAGGIRELRDPGRARRREALRPPVLARARAARRRPVARRG